MSLRALKYVVTKSVFPSRSRQPDHNYYNKQATTTNLEATMSATDRTDAFEVGIAHVNFRVRCETLGHGDEVFLVSDEGQGARKVCSVWLDACFVLLLLPSSHVFFFRALRGDKYIFDHLFCPLARFLELRLEGSSTCWPPPVDDMGSLPQTFLAEGELVSSGLTQFDSKNLRRCPVY